MCHLVLFLPVLALPVFWFLTLPAAIAVYGLVLIVSLALYVQVMIGMRRPLFGGPNAIIGREGRLIPLPHEHLGLAIDGETWRVRASDPLTVGQRVRVLEREGLCLIVTPSSTQEGERRYPTSLATQDRAACGILHGGLQASHRGARSGR